MGGHSTARNSEFYNETAKAAKLATEKGYFVVSGGGPGIMEASKFRCCIWQIIQMKI